MYAITFQGRPSVKKTPCIMWEYKGIFCENQKCKIYHTFLLGEGGKILITDDKLFSFWPSPTTRVLPLQEATTVETCGEGWSATETLGCLLPLPDPVASLQVPFIASTSTCDFDIWTIQLLLLEYAIPMSVCLSVCLWQKCGPLLFWGQPNEINKMAWCIDR